MGGDLDIQDIQICDASGAVLEEMANEVAIQKMDSAGGYLDSIGYCPTFDGWNVDFETVERGAYTFKNGESICVNNDFGETVYFRVSGEVDLVNKNEIGTGFVLWGNSTPVKIDITEVDIVNVSGEIFEEMANEVAIQKMDSAGGYLDSIGYCPTFDGWNVDFETLEKGVFTLEPGEAVCVNNDFGETVYMKLPCPIKK